jgi:monofunctional biosynthetic peptidoglycan transglycosylase
MKIIAPSLLALISSACFATADEGGAKHRLLTDFRERGVEKRWITVNDNVMGGRSKGGPSIGDGILTFSGATNTDGGGFSSIRNESKKHDLGEFSAVRVRVKGDGRTYKLELRTGARVMRSRGVPYRADFETRKDVWMEVDIPFSKFKPTFRGFDMSNRAPALDPAKIKAVGFMIYDKQDGPFQLQVDWVKAVPSKS